MRVCTFCTDLDMPLAHTARELPRIADEVGEHLSEQAGVSIRNRQGGDGPPYRTLWVLTFDLFTDVSGEGSHIHALTFELLPAEPGKRQ